VLQPTPWVPEKKKEKIILKAHEIAREVQPKSEELASSTRSKDF
jgi:hypothetical protein